MANKLPDSIPTISEVLQRLALVPTEYIPFWQSVAAGLFQDVDGKLSIRDNNAKLAAQVMCTLFKYIEFVRDLPQPLPRSVFQWIEQLSQSESQCKPVTLSQTDTRELLSLLINIRDMSTGTDNSGVPLTPINVTGVRTGRHTSEKSSMPVDFLMTLNARLKDRGDGVDVSTFETVVRELFGDGNIVLPPRSHNLYRHDLHAAWTLHGDGSITVGAPLDGWIQSLIPDLEEAGQA